MYLYETLFVLRADVPEAQIRETIDRARRLIEGMEGVPGEVHEWGVRDLAYPIQKETRGYYILLEYQGKPAVVVEFERNLRIADEVLRYITVRQIPRRRKSMKRAVITKSPHGPTEGGEGGEPQTETEAKTDQDQENANAS